MIYIESSVDLEFDRNKGVKIQVSNKSLTSAGSNLSVVCFIIFVSSPSYWRPFFVRDFLLNGSSSSFSVCCWRSFHYLRAKSHFNQTTFISDFLLSLFEFTLSLIHKNG